jgi:hypothetical protein
MVLPLAGVLHPPDAAATGLARQHEAGDEETGERGNGGHAGREQRQSRLAGDHQEQGIRPSHAGKTRERPCWLRSGENRRENLAHDVVERIRKQIVVRLRAEHRDIGPPVLDPVGMLSRRCLDG